MTVITIKNFTSSKKVLNSNRDITKLMSSFLLKSHNVPLTQCHSKLFIIQHSKLYKYHN